MVHEWCIGYTRRVEPALLAPTIDAVIDQVIFSDPDPRVQKLKEEWEAEQRREREAFERVCREEYDRRLDYHRICQTRNPATEARKEVNLCKPVWEVELKERLGIIWSGVVMRVAQVLEDLEGR